MSRAGIVVGVALGVGVGLRLLVGVALFVDGLETARIAAPWLGRAAHRGALRPIMPSAYGAAALSALRSENKATTTTITQDTSGVYKEFAKKLL